MPTVPLSILDCAIYLYPSVAAAEQGEQFGGSGFLLIVPFEGQPVRGTMGEQTVGTVYAVTCSHVVRPPQPGAQGASVVRLNTQDDRLEVLPLESSAWIHHPTDDIAIAPIGLSSDVHRFSLIPSGMCVKQTRDDLSWMSPGTDTMMVGRFVTHEGRQRNTPTLRFGNVSMLPLEPVMTERGVLQDSFLVEVRSLPGYSGSPIFGYVPIPASTTEWKGTGPPPLGGGSMKLLGIDWGHLSQRAAVREPDGTVTSDKLWVKLNSGMAGVVPAWKLTELLEEDEEVVEMRRHDEETWKKEHPLSQAVSPVDTPAATPDEP